MTPLILGLDLATKTGYALLYGEDVIEYGEWTKGGSNAQRYLALQDELSHIREDFTGERGYVKYSAKLRNSLHIAYERAMFQQGVASERYHTLRTCLEVFCYLNDIPLASYPVATVKKAAGKGNADKEYMVERANAEFGTKLKPFQHDIADALWVAKTHQLELKVADSATLNDLTVTD